MCHFGGHSKWTTTIYLGVGYDIRDLTIEAISNKDSDSLEFAYLILPYPIT